MVAQELVAKKLSVRQAEALVARSARSDGEGTPLPKAKPKSRDILRLEERLSDLLTAQVDIRVKRRTKRGEQGEVAIQFGSLEELNGLLEMLGASES